MRTVLTAIPLTIVATVALAQTVPTSGEVTKIDVAQGKLTLKHGPIKNLDMEGMTMVFAISDPAMLKTMKVGDKVTFEAERVNGRLTVTKISKAK